MPASSLLCFSALIRDLIMRSKPTQTADKSAKVLCLNRRISVRLPRVRPSIQLITIACTAVGGFKFIRTFDIDCTHLPNDGRRYALKEPALIVEISAVVDPILTEIAENQQGYDSAECQKELRVKLLKPPMFLKDRPE